MRRKIKRLHSEDARFLRNMFYDLIERMNELEFHMGEIQRRLGPEVLAARQPAPGEPAELAK